MVCRYPVSGDQYTARFVFAQDVRLTRLRDPGKALARGLRQRPDPSLTMEVPVTSHDWSGSEALQTARTMPERQ